MTALTVLADDLTGALDTGVKFAGGERSVTVVWSPGARSADVIIVDTETRSAPGHAAARLAADWARAADGLIYKKMDSTLRGPFAAEARAVAEVRRMTGVLVAPAFPGAGRTVRDGVLLVRGTPVHEAGFAQDPGSPVTESRVATVVERQVGGPVGLLGLAEIRRGAEEVTAALRRQRGFVLADAETEADLAVLARAVVRQEGWLPAGSAGLAAALAHELGFPPPRLETPRAADGFLLVCGSAHPVNRRQMTRLAEVTGIDPVHAEPGGEGGFEQARKGFERQGLAMLITPDRRMDAQEAWRVRLQMMEWSARAVRDWQVSGLYATGGQTLRSTLDELGVESLRPLAEVAPGVVCSEAELPAGRRLEVVSKAGGFGDDDLLVRLFGGRSAVRAADRERK